MVTYGDGLSDIDLSDLVAFHKDHGRIATLTAVRATSQFGHLQLDGPGVTQIIENPELPDWINGGFMVFRREIFDWLQPDDPLEAGAIKRLAQAGELMAYRHQGFWACMDTYKDNLRLNELWESENPPWKEW
jgi:glucose-1-phosphate cytidylyltransferase